MPNTHFETLSDLEIVAQYNNGNRDAAATLFNRHKKFLDHLATNTVRLPRTDETEKRSIVYLTFLEAFPEYARRDNASFQTFMTRCVKNALLSEYRRLNAKKRAGDIRTVSLDSTYYLEQVNKRIYYFWQMEQRE